LHRHIGKEIRAVANLIHRKACKNNDPIPYPTCDDPIFNTQGSNLTGMQKLFLHYIWIHRHEDVFQRDLEQEFSIRRATATGILQLMEKNGYIIRTTSERDARLKKITLTDKALKIHTHSMAQIKSIEEQMRSGISDRDLDIFFDVLDKIKVNLTNDD
jgi:MarR family transcriptional repressor of mepA